MYYFPNFEPVCCSMSVLTACFLSCIQVSQDAGKVVWNSHLFKNIPEFVVIHIVKGFRKGNEAEVDGGFFIFFLFSVTSFKWVFHLTIFLLVNSLFQLLLCIFFIPPPFQTHCLFLAFSHHFRQMRLFPSSLVSHKRYILPISY